MPYYNQHTLRNLLQQRRKLRFLGLFVNFELAYQFGPLRIVVGSRALLVGQIESLDFVLLLFRNSKIGAV
jgi:hypothetical protein